MQQFKLIAVSFLGNKMDFKKITIIFSHSPYESSISQEGLHFLLAASTINLPIKLIFIDDGIWLLKKHQEPEIIKYKNFTAGFSALSLYDIEDLYIEQASLTARGLTLDDLFIKPIPMDTLNISHLLDNQDLIFHF